MNPTPAQLLIRELLACGGYIDTRQGQPRLMGPIPDELKARLKANKDDVLDAWDKWERDRYDKTPPDDHPTRTEPPQWRRDVYLRVEQYARNQSDAVVQWVFRQAQKYQAQFPAWDETDVTKAALRDLLYWQLGRYQKPEDILRLFDETVALLNRKP